MEGTAERSGKDGRGWARTDKERQALRKGAAWSVKDRSGEARQALRWAGDRLGGDCRGNERRGQVWQGNLLGKHCGGLRPCGVMNVEARIGTARCGRHCGKDWRDVAGRGNEWCGLAGTKEWQRKIVSGKDGIGRH